MIGPIMLEPRWWMKDGAEDAGKQLARILYELFIPDHMRPGIARYVLQGIIPGSFLVHILENDFALAAVCADLMNRHWLYSYAILLHNLPEPCWGSEAKMTAWHEAKGLVGLAMAGSKT